MLTVGVVICLWLCVETDHGEFHRATTCILVLKILFSVRMHFFLVDFFVLGRVRGDIAVFRGYPFSSLLCNGDIVGFNAQDERLSKCEVLDRSVHLTWFCSLEVVTKPVDFVELNGFRPAQLMFWSLRVSRCA